MASLDNLTVTVSVDHIEWDEAIDKATRRLKIGDHEYLVITEEMREKLRSLSSCFGVPAIYFKHDRCGCYSLKPCSEKYVAIWRA